MTQILTTEQVAQRLRKSVSQVNRDAKDGKIPTIFQGTGIRGPRLFDAAQIEQIERGDK